MIIYTKDIDKSLDKVRDVFGIHEIAVGYLFKDRDLDSISKHILELIKDKDFKTFKVIVKRSDKKYPGNSTEIASKIGSYILKNKHNIKVDVHNPELSINVEIRLNEVLFYDNGTPGLGGYPVSTLGKGL